MDKSLVISRKVRTFVRDNNSMALNVSWRDGYAYKG